MAAAQSKRQSRKRRRSGTAARPPVAAAPARSAAKAPPRSDPRVATRANQQGPLATTLTGRTYGDPPPNRFGGVPVSELAILVGAIAVIVGWSTAAAPALVVGVVVCVLAVGEVTAREHFSGYRSHSTLLAGIPAVGIGVALIALVGGSLQRGTLLLIVVPVFAILFWLLRKRFVSARQARIIRPPVA